jgi:hypothetical protein
MSKQGEIRNRLMVVGELTRAGFQVPAATTREELQVMMRQLKLVRSFYDVYLADMLVFGRQAFGDEALMEIVEQEEFELSDVKRAMGIGQLEFDFRHRHEGLTAEHFYVLATMCQSEEEREKWAKQARDHDLTGLELKRSLEEGRVMSREELRKKSGSQSGIRNLEAVFFEFDMWAKQTGGVQAVEKFEVESLRKMYEQN